MTSQYDDLIRGMLAKSQEAARRKCFISYYHGDQDAVDKFVGTFDDVMIAKAIGVSEEDDYIDSDNAEYVMSRIRQDVLEDSTVTICLIGECTHSRRYIDWELKASLRQGEDYDPNGLIGILLPHMGNTDTYRKDSKRIGQKTKVRPTQSIEPTLQAAPSSRVGSKKHILAVRLKPSISLTHAI